MSAFLLDAGQRLSDFEERLALCFRVRSEARETQDQVQLLDTFDWRLYKAGWLLILELSGRMRLLRLLSWQTGEEMARLRLPKACAWVREIPDGSLHDLLAPVVQVRRLLVRLQAERRACTLHLEDEEGKTHLRLHWEQLTGSVAPADSCTLRWLQFEPLKGYEASFEIALNAVQETGGLSALPGSPWPWLAQALGLVPGDYSTKVRVDMHPGAAALIVVRDIQRQLLQTLNANLDGVRADLDPEYLHDFRVAVRRTRSMLSQLKTVFPHQVWAHFRKEFAWLQQITGPTRDLDVYLLKFPVYRDSLPPPLQHDLTPLHRYLAAHQRKEQRRMVGQLNSARFTALLADWNLCLEQELRVSNGQSAPTVEEVVRRRVWKLYRRVLKQGRSIREETPAEALHDLRKMAKKLRYVLEFFQPLFPAEVFADVLRMMKRLLDNLGNFQDLTVQAEALHQFAADMNRKSRVPMETLLAMGVLIGDLLKRRERVREEFAALFKELDSPRYAKEFTAVFKP